jgi:hypothetical protein
MEAACSGVEGERAVGARILSRSGLRRVRPATVGTRPLPAGPAGYRIGPNGAGRRDSGAVSAG